MHAPDAGSVIVDKVRFCRWRILRRAGTAFAAACIGPPGRVGDSEEAPGLRKGTRTGPAEKPTGEFVTHVHRNCASNEDDFRPKAKEHHKLAGTLQGY
jgi:hypothetical protein